MRIKGQHGEFGYQGKHGYGGPVPKRQIEIEEGERISIKVMNRKCEPPQETEILSYFTPGVLTVDWEQGAKIEQ